MNPGLPAALFDSFNSDEDANDPIKDVHQASIACSVYVYARQLKRSAQRASSTCWPIS